MPTSNNPELRASYVDTGTDDLFDPTAPDLRGVAAYYWNQLKLAPEVAATFVVSEGDRELFPELTGVAEVRLTRGEQGVNVRASKQLPPPPPEYPYIDEAEKRRAYLDKKLATFDLDRLLVNGLVSVSIPDVYRFGRVLWTPSGERRFAATLAWLATMYTNTATRELARAMMADLHKQLGYLALYGGFTAGVMEPAPRYLVEIGDDCSLGGFTLMWWAAVHPDRQAELAERTGKDAPRYLDEVRDDVPTYTSRPCSYLPLPVGAIEYGGLTPKDDRFKPLRGEPVLWRYGMSMNGGLLLHGWPGSDPLAVELGNLKSIPHWSVHT